MKTLSVTGEKENTRHGNNSNARRRRRLFQFFLQLL